MKVLNPTTGPIELPGLGARAGSRIEPLPVSMLDSMTISGKMTLTTKIGSIIFGSVNHIHPSPGLMHTYTRLYVYTEIDQLKTLIGSKLPDMISKHNWVQLHMVVEILRYRLHHVPVGHQIQARVLSSINLTVRS